MQRAILQQATLTGFQTQAAQVAPGHGTGFEDQAVNDDSFRDDSFRDDSFRDDSFRDDSFRDDSFRDDSFRDNSYRDDPCQKESSRLMLVVSVLANVIGGSLFLGGMFSLPYLIARILS